MSNGWTDRAPEPRQYALIRLVRVPPQGSITGICTGETYLGKNTHWDNYRTQPCDDPDCELCRQGKPVRWQAYLDMLGQTTNRQFVVQITPLVAKALDEARETYGHLRGLLLAFTRVARRNNARIIVDARQLPTPWPNLPPAIDIAQYMNVIWQSATPFTTPSGARTAADGTQATPATDAFRKALEQAKELNR